MARKKADLTPEERKARQRAAYLKYKRKNREMLRRKYRAWYAANREKGIAATTRWVQRNKEHVALYMKTWTVENKDSINTRNRNRAAKKRNAGSHTKEDIEDRIKWQKNKCAYCKNPLKKKRHVDHIKPLSKGGSNLPSNLQILCPSCNLRKYNRLPEDHARKIGMLL